MSPRAETTTNYRQWDDYYARGTWADPNRRMGTLRTYRRAASWLDQSGYSVEDWGGGVGYAQRFFTHAASYTVVDGSQTGTPHAHVLLDLSTPEAASRTPDSLLLRHVLEHCHDGQWKAVLSNALTAFQHRMTLNLNAPYAEATRTRLRSNRKSCYDEQEFSREDLAAVIRPVATQLGISATEELVGREQLIYLAKGDDARFLPNRG